jgi:hypothetical protein
LRLCMALLTLAEETVALPSEGTPEFPAHVTVLLLPAAE